MSPREAMFWLLGVLIASMIGLAFFKAIDDHRQSMKEQFILQKLDRLEKLLEGKSRADVVH